MNAMFFKFIWNNKPDKVKRNVLCNTRDNGDVKMVDMSTFDASLQIKWIKLFLDDQHRPWKMLFEYSFRNYGGHFLSSCNFRKGDIIADNIFTSKVCYSWANFHFKYLIVIMETNSF